MKKILLIGSEGVLGKYFKTKLSNKNNILFLADIKNNTKYSKKNVHHFRLDLRSEKQMSLISVVRGFSLNSDRTCESVHEIFSSARDRIISL